MEKINILSFNIKNFKTNNYFLTKLIVNNEIDICFLTETWLAEEENSIIAEKIGLNYYILNQNEMTISKQKKGRPYGGKSWLIDKKFKICKNIFINNDVSYIQICDSNNQEKLVIVGVHLPFDDNSSVRIANYISNLEIIKNIIDENLNQPIFIIGDFNTDLNMDKRYSKQLAKFIEEYNLRCMDYDYPNITYTYRNGDYKNHIDHVIVNQLARKITVECKIIEDNRNMSDHNAIKTSLWIDINASILNYNEKLNNNKNFYRFPWKEEKFVENYQKALNESLQNFDYELNDNITENSKSDYIERKFDELRKILLKAARIADKSSQKQLSIKKYKYNQIQQSWTPELGDISRQLNYWYEIWLSSNRLNNQALMNYKFYRKRLKWVQKIIIEKNSRVKVLNLGRVYKTERNTFWKLIKKYKTSLKRVIETNKLSLNDFEMFYSKLFSHEGILENDSHKQVYQEVKSYYDSIKNKKFNVEISSNLIESCLKKLRNNKAIGSDKICNEMLKNAKSNKLLRVLKNMYADMINEGILLNNFNISIITPIQKKDTNNSAPEDFRPISVSNTFSNIYEMILLDKMEHLFKFNNKQFGYKSNSSCKHASFVINETLSYYKKGGSPCYVISLDMKKAFDRMWRDGLFSKLKTKIEEPIWRALVNYYQNSKGKVKINYELSSEFIIKEGVKQGGILSPYLFNYFMNDLLNENDKKNLGASIGSYNVGLLSYCDDLIILSPHVSHVNKILQMCEFYAINNKLVFNTNKCNWYLHGKAIIDHPNFKINNDELNKVNSLIHLGLPIGNQKHIEEFFCDKFKKVERSLYTLYSLGCKANGLNYYLIANIYKKFCQSIFYYGLETNYIRKECLNMINTRQNILLKNTFGFSKYCKTTPLLNAINIKSILQLYDEYKIIFLKQIKRNQLTKNIYDFLLLKYNSGIRPSRESYFNILKQLCIKYKLDFVNINIKTSIEIINCNYASSNDGLVDSLRFLISKTGSTSFDEQSLTLMKLLLTVQSNLKSNMQLS